VVQLSASSAINWLALVTVTPLRSIRRKSIEGVVR
jgi:hypothetical protein